MEKIYLIFDYFKEAFHMNKDNKKIYGPQIALIILKTLTVIVCGLIIYSYIGSDKFMDYDASKWFFFVITSLLWLGLLLLGLGIISLIVESGLYNMYKKCVINNELAPGDFKEGVKKYFFKFLLGDILVAVAWIVICIPYLIVGVITLTIGLAVIPLIANIFLTMWKVSIVMKDNDVITAFKDSFSFAKRNFLALTVLQLIHWAFVKGATTSGGFNSYYSFTNPSSPANSVPGKYSSFNGPSMEDVVKVAKIICAILIPVISIATFVASIITMIFEVFFSLVIFIAYIKKFESENTLEVTPDVV